MVFPPNMADTGIVRFPGSLDPGAEEFRPRNSSNSPNPNQATLFGPPPPLLPASHQVYYPYTSPPYPTPISEVVPPYPQQFLSPAAYVSAPVPPASVAATRAVLLSSVPSDVGELRVREELEGFGEVRWVQMERACEGIVTVHFYDLRHAERTLREIREQHMQQQTRLRNHYTALLTPNSGPHHHPLDHNSTLLPLPPPAVRGLIAGQAVWAQFVIPASNAVPDGHNQGTIVIFNLDSAVATSTLKETFQAFGAVKELRETPSKKHQRFVEFFDVRDAAKALKEMNGKEIHGRTVVIEFSRPGGHSRKFLNALTNSPPTLVTPNIAPLHVSSNSFLYPTTSNYATLPPPPPSILPELPLKFSGRAGGFNVAHRMYTSQIQFSSRKPNSSKGSSNNGNGSSNSATVESKMAALNLGCGVEVNSGSGNGIEDRDSLGPSKRSSSKKGYRNNQNQAMETSKQQQQQPRSSRVRKGRQAKKFDSKFLIKEDAIGESTSGDSRTTVMIKNIPNKYSQKLLLNMLDNHCIHSNEQIIGSSDDEHPLSSYDFVYLPIDFNNKCNVGYGFVNMTSPQATWRLYKAFHLQHWEVFNSRKICEVTYARVQGLEALKEHFKNSKFPCEMDHYLPVVFSPPRDGRQLTEPLPIVGAQNQNKQHNFNTSDSNMNHPVALLLPPPHHHHHHHHRHDADAQHSEFNASAASGSDGDDSSSSRSGGVVVEDDDQLTNTARAS